MTEELPELAAQGVSIKPNAGMDGNWNYEGGGPR